MTTTPQGTTHRSSAATTGVAGSDGLARIALKLDGVVTGSNGLAYLALATVLDSFLGFDTGVMYPVGVFLLVYGIGVLALGTRPTLSRPALGLVIAANAAWVVLSITLLAADTLTPTGAGQIWTALQALTVGGFAALQYLARARL